MVTKEGIRNKHKTILLRNIYKVLCIGNSMKMAQKLGKPMETTKAYFLFGLIFTYMALIDYPISEFKQGRIPYINGDY